MAESALSFDEEREQPLTAAAFASLLSGGFTQLLTGVEKVAVGVSGGPDSMALAHLLCEWAAARKGGPEIHILSVDHGLRPEAAQEAVRVGEWVKDWPQAVHTILTAHPEQNLNPSLRTAKGGEAIQKMDDGAVDCFADARNDDKEAGTPSPQTRIMENSRNRRYEAFSKYCREQGIRHLFLAHHQDDQAETFLFRLSKGSGLDGLAAMAPAQDYSGGLTLLRPLLAVPKARLIATCESRGISYINDPSNESDKYARPRLRKARDVLEAEGLSAKRLSVTAMRLARARQALDDIAEMALMDIAIEKEPKRTVLNYTVMKAWPGEIGLRVLIKAMNALGRDSDYGPRMEKVEDLFEALMLEPDFRKRTLGGVIVDRDDKKGHVLVTQENMLKE